MNEQSTSAAPERSRSLRETMLMAGSSGTTFLLSLVRTKVLAMVWGPIGVGVMGMMQASMSTATLLSGLGVDAIATREVAKAYSAEPARTAQLVSAIVRGVSVLAAAGAAASFVGMVALRERLGLGSNLAIAILAVGIFASVSSASLRGALSAMGHLRSVASSNIAAALLATAAAAGLVFLPARTEVWALAVLLVPLAQWCAIAWSFRRVPAMPRTPWADSIRDVLGLARQARLLALAGVLPVLAQLLTRSFTRASLAPEAFGCFQAAMALAATSVSVLASSVGPSVLPRLSAAAHQPKNLAAVVNDQTGVYLTLFAPVALGLVALPEIVIRLLYSHEFDAVADQLSWQMVGEVLRLPSWVLATVLTARGRTRAYLLSEASSLATLVVGTALAAQSGRLALIGTAVSASAVLQFLLLTHLVRADGVVWERSIISRLALLIVAVVVCAAFARTSMPVRVIALCGVGFAFWQTVQLLATMRNTVTRA